MALQDRIAKLESLLGRIRRNASKPRAAAVEAASPEPAPSSPAPELEVEMVDDDAIEELDVTDEGIVELSPDTGAVTTFSDIDFEEEPPESAPRSAASLAEALGSVSKYSEEPPLKTPPPESGRQALTPAPEAPVRDEDRGLSGAGDVDALLEATSPMEEFTEAVELESEADAEPVNLPMSVSERRPTAPDARPIQFVAAEPRPAETFLSAVDDSLSLGG